MDNIISVEITSTDSTKTDGNVRGALYVFGKQYWTTKTGEMFEWEWLDLLEYLVRNFDRLYSEQEYPIPLLGVGHPGELLDVAEKRWDGLSQEDRSVEEREVFSFLLAHNLSEGMADAELPALILMRDGDLAWVVDVDNNAKRVPFIQLMDDVLEMGDAIAKAYENSAGEHIQKVINQWRGKKEQL